MGIFGTKLSSGIKAQIIHAEIPGLDINDYHPPNVFGCLHLRANVLVVPLSRLAPDLFTAEK